MPKISELDEAVVLDGEEYVSVVQDGITRKHKLRNAAFGIQEPDEPIDQLPAITSTTATIIIGDLTGGYSGDYATRVISAIGNDPVHTGVKNIICVGDVSDNVAGQDISGLLTGFAAICDNLFSAAGNHDYDAGITGLKAFDGNANFDDTYFKVGLGDVDLFFVDSNTHLDNNISSAAAFRASTMGVWVADELDASNAAWKGIVFHHPAYSSGAAHGSNAYMQLDWDGLGAHFVLMGHSHIYERLHVDGVVYLTAGTAGGVTRSLGTVLPQSRSQLSSTSGIGYIRMTADSNNLILQFLNTGNVVQDTVRLYKKS